MKNTITIFTLVFLLSSHKFVFTQATGVTFIGEMEYAKETKPTADGNLITLGRPDLEVYNYNLTKLTSDGDIIWSNNIDGPGGYTYLNDIFSLVDGSYIVFNGDYFLKFDESGDFILSKIFTSEELGFTPIPGDGGTVYYADVIQVDGGFIFYSNGNAGINDFIAITKLDENGNSIWSYAYTYDNYNGYSIIINGDYVYVSMAIYYPVGSHQLVKINSIDGTVVSENSYDEYHYDSKFFNVGDGIIESAKMTNLGNESDVLIKYNYDGDTLWTNKINYAVLDTGFIVDIITLPSGNLMSINMKSNIDAYYDYILRYYNEVGDTILNIYNFIPIDQFYINDLERNGDNLIFSGEYVGFGEESGFVLITDTLGQFLQLVIQGTIYYDENDNGILDAEEFTFHDRLLHTEPLGFYALTNADGEYTMHIYDPGIYILNTENPEYWDVMDPIDYTIEFDPLVLGDTLFNKDFRLDYTVPVMDLRVTINQGNIAPGFDTYSDLTVENVGNQIAVDATAILHHPAGFNYTSGTPYTDYTDTIITWSFTDLDPFAPVLLESNFIASLDYTIGDIKMTLGSIEPIIGDYLITNNKDSIYKTVVASFDPNHKSVEPAGIGTNGYVDPSTEWLEYTIEFQNIGTAPATFVNINDVIDSHLDLNSFEMLSAKHAYWIELNENTLIWHFDNINLPDSASDPQGSCGFVTYKIKIKEDADIGTEIRNTAFIYFDYNDPVITNTTKTTLYLPNSIAEFDPLMSVHPNPAGDHIILQFEEENTSGFNIKIYNINGEVVLEEVLEAGKQMIQINSSNYPNGIYFINCSDVGGILKTNAKFIVTH